MSNRRPWRAMATELDPTTATGRRVVGHCAALTEEALQPWITARREQGCAVTVQEVLVLTETSGTPAPAAARR